MAAVSTVGAASRRLAATARSVNVRSARCNFLNGADERASISSGRAGCSDHTSSETRAAISRRPIAADAIIDGRHSSAVSRNRLGVRANGRQTASDRRCIEMDRPRAAPREPADLIAEPHERESRATS